TRVSAFFLRHVHLPHRGRIAQARALLRVGGRCSVSVSPSRLAPVFVPRLWGSRSLAPLFDSAPAASEPIGEVWLTGDPCTFASGPLTGRSLGESWAGLSAEWKGHRL